MAERGNGSGLGEAGIERLAEVLSGAALKFDSIAEALKPGMEQEYRGTGKLNAGKTVGETPQEDKRAAGIAAPPADILDRMSLLINNAAVDIQMLAAEFTEGETVLGRYAEKGGPGTSGSPAPIALIEGAGENDGR